MRHQELWRAVGTHYGPTRIYGPTGHAIRGTAQQALRSFYHSHRSQASALSVTTTGLQRSVGAWTPPPPPGPARLARVDNGPAMQLAHKNRSDAVRRDRRLRDSRKRACASVREHGTRRAGQVNSTRHALGIYYSVVNTDFSTKGPHFSAKCKILPQTVKDAERALFARIQLGPSWAQYPGRPRAFFGEPHVDVT